MKSNLNYASIILKEIILGKIPMQGKFFKTILLLSGGARASEDLYFLDTAAPYLKKRHGFKIKRIDTLKNRPPQESVFKNLSLIHI